MAYLRECLRQVRLRHGTWDESRWRDAECAPIHGEADDDEAVEIERPRWADEPRPRPFLDP